jgi:hypothetical protein
MYYGNIEGHDYERCRSDATGNSCSGCRHEGSDCVYESLAFCKVCGGMEGSLLPVCPGRRLSIEEDAHNYAMYCQGIGPFGECNHLNVVEACEATGIYANERRTAGSLNLLNAVNDLLDYVRPELPE